MAVETEKLTINLGLVDLAQIDVLVEQGIYSNRSDLIRSAVRKQLEADKSYIEQSLMLSTGKYEHVKVLGVGVVTKSFLEEFFDEGKKIDITTIGMLTITNNVSTELFERTVGKITVKGKLVAPPEIKTIIDRMEAES